MKKTIGIIGGMGPLATADLFEKLIHSTDAARDSSKRLLDHAARMREASKKKQ